MEAQSGVATRFGHRHSVTLVVGAADTLAVWRDHRPPRPQGRSYDLRHCACGSLPASPQPPRAARAKQGRSRDRSGGGGGCGCVDPLGCRSGGSVGSVRYASGRAAEPAGSSPAGTVGTGSPAEAGGISPAGTVGCETPWTPWKPVRRVCAAAAEPGDTAVKPDAVCMTGMRAAHRRPPPPREDPHASRLGARTPRLRGTCSGDPHLGQKSAGIRNGFI